MLEQCENTCESIGLMADKPKEDKVYKYEINSLERRLNDLSKEMTTLTVIVETLAKNSGIKIERYVGTIVITTI